MVGNKALGNESNFIVLEVKIMRKYWYICERRMCRKGRNTQKRKETLTFSFLKRVRMLPSSLSTRSLSCSLFGQLRTSLINTERPLMPERAIFSQIQQERHAYLLFQLRITKSSHFPPPQTRILDNGM